MRRSCRIDDVVPVMERLVKDHLFVKLVLERFFNLSYCLIDFADDSRMHLQTSSCGGVGGSFASIFNREQRCSTPGMSYL